MRFLVSPLLYFASIIPAVVGIVAVFSSIEFGGFLYRYDHLTPGTDEVGLAIVLIVAGLVFVASSQALILLERLSHPRLTDHLRRCAFVYLLFVVLSAALIPEYMKANRLPGYPGPEILGQVLWLATGCALLVDGLMLVVRRRQFTRSGIGASA